MRVFKGDQKTEWEFRDNRPIRGTGERLPHVHLGQARIARFKIGYERTESPPELRLVWDRLARCLVVENAVQVDEVAGLIAIAKGVELPRAHISK